MADRKRGAVSGGLGHRELHRRLLPSLAQNGLVIIRWPYTILRKEKERMKQKVTNVRSKAVALGRLLKTSDGEFKAYMDTYKTLFTDSPENTKDDYDNGVPLRGYKQGSSPELEQYYKLIHLMCTLGSVEKMYLPPVMDVQKSVAENQNLFERQLAKDIDVGEGDTVLDLGCGCGAIAAHIATLRGCTMYGINIEKSQIEKARKTRFCRKVGRALQSLISTSHSNLATTSLTRFTMSKR